MADRQYVGICIGGPKAGEMIAHFARQMEVRELVQRRPGESIHDAKGKITHYIHHHTGGPLNLWLYEGMDLVEALRLMAEAYVEKVQVRQIVEDREPPGADIEFVNAWINMEVQHGYQYSDSNIEKVYLGWRMHRKMKQVNGDG